MNVNHSVNEKEQQLKTTFNIGVKYFQTGEFDNAYQEFEKALKYDITSQEVVFALKWCRYWQIQNVSLKNMDDPDHSAEFLMSKWKDFYNYFIEHEKCSASTILAIKKWLFGRNLDYYLPLSGKSRVPDSRLFLQIGRCYKGVGDYKSALDYLELVHNRLRNNAPIIAEIADCYDSLNEGRLAKLFFREAFYIAPQEVEIEYLESELIQQLIAFIRKKGYNIEEQKEWLPVYGVTHNLLSVKRELKAHEYGRLQQDIFLLSEQIQKSDSKNAAVLRPKLINRYIWLLDHYRFTGASREKQDEVLRKIARFDQSVFQLL